MHSEQVFNLLTKEYTLKLATTAQDFSTVKQIRREVFAAKYSMSPELLESKGYLFSQDDEQSFLYLLRHNKTNTYIGTIRVFFINSYTAIQSLPMEKDGNVEGISHLTKTLPICEVSRLALSNDLE
jgi:hypothetical protein